MKFLKNMRKINIFVLLSILLNIANIKAHHVPLNPCPNLFQYKTDGTVIYGSFTLGNTQVGQSYTVDMRFTILGNLPSTYVGELVLLEGKDRTLKNIENKKPIIYKVKFPVRDRIPRLTEIKVNNNVVCAGSPDTGNVITNIHLQNTLHTNTITYFSTRPEIKNPNTVRSKPKLNQITTQQYYPNYDTTVYYINENNNYPIQAPNVVLPSPVVKNPTIPPIRRPAQTTLPQFQDPAVTVNSICGQDSVKLKPLVIGGEVTGRGDWPWLVAIYLNDPKSLSFRCGGNLISTRTVVTAAHCFKLKGVLHPANNILIFAGRYSLVKWNEDGSATSAAQTIFIHPDYNDDLTSFDADVAVVLLKEPVKFNSNIKPICLWNEPSNDLRMIEGEEGIVVGWGKDELGREVSPEPKKVSATIVSETTCLRSDIRFINATSSRTFCAGKRNGEGPCSGDSGGGLMIRRNGRWVLRGTVSGTVPDTLENTCEHKDFVIYSDIAKFVDWIHRKMVF